MKQKLPSFDQCFCCGKNNAVGLQSPFYVDGCEVKTSYVPTKNYCGYPGIQHGGITATLLDEAMTWAATVAGKRFCYAGEIKVRYCAPVIEGEEICISAKVTGSIKKWLIVEGKITDKNLKVLAKSEGKYISLDESSDIEVKKQNELNRRMF